FFAIDGNLPGQSPKDDVNCPPFVGVKVIGFSQRWEGLAQARSVLIRSRDTRTRIQVLTELNALFLCTDGWRLDRLFRAGLFLDHATLGKVDAFHDLAGKYLGIVIARYHEVSQCAFIESAGDGVVDQYQGTGDLHFEFDDRCSAGGN